MGKCLKNITKTKYRKGHVWVGHGNVRVCDKCGLTRSRQSVARNGVAEKQGARERRAKASEED